ncbi:hypothetical protein PFICI_01548 [Pestalotiopsis fici W106-1]|uniref:Uncharacterized protein n=1 Tax=Pestalotiopsis fici (strain W106-1 / CGMCC3.15140) TaxID=1229662 RepID=W3XP47_PESFW|nr:uncharacterized protein PFICI_01548 [Pestalotiopsis fici W106-1]ETS87720.1 hypothetical protein PFICI_01548 [Pestalotiopsis fici W106-1]
MAASMQRLLWRQASRASFSSVCSSSSIAGRVQARASFASSALSRATTAAPRTPTKIATTAARRAYSTEPPKGSNNSIKFWPFVVIIALGTGGYAMIVNRRAGMFSAFETSPISSSEDQGG